MNPQAARSLTCVQSDEVLADHHRPVPRLDQKVSKLVDLALFPLLLS
jgi:hypothetical protein